MTPAADETTLANFEVHGNVLIANVEMFWENHAEFIRSCDELLKSPEPRLILDLSHVTFLFSAYMGTIGKLLADCTRQNRRLAVRVTRNLGWLFELVGFEKMLDLEVVP